MSDFMDNYSLYKLIGTSSNGYQYMYICNPDQFNSREVRELLEFSKYAIILGYNEVSHKWDVRTEKVDFSGSTLEGHETLEEYNKAVRQRKIPTRFEKFINLKVQEAADNMVTAYFEGTR